MPSILVVDDCSIDRRLVGGLLCCVPGWELRFACDGEEAWREIVACPPDVVVTDLQMPHLDGLELVRRVKQHFPNLPVILITSQGSQQIALAALREGAAHYTPKRLMARDLMATIRHVLGITDHVQHAANDADEVSRRLVDGVAVDGHGPGSRGDELAIAFELENDDRLIGKLIEYLQANLPGWAEPDALQVAMALHEAITNAMHHGNLEVSSGMRDACETEYFQLIRERKTQPPYAERRVRISASFCGDQVRFRITDEGPGFDPSSVADPTTEENLEKLSGRGLLLIRSFMDRVYHNDVGNEITMIKQKKRDAARPLQSLPGLG
jgi:CheY-like chemotaxis protein/anti-sigma regulatory factor (Ser/Thr protein kinase)